MLRKLSTATIMKEAGIEAWSKFKDGETKKFLYVISGTAVGVKTGDGNFGPWTAFVGEFAAMTSDGQVFDGAKCFIPQPVESQLAAALANTDAKGIKFSLAVFIRPPTDDETVKYVYIVDPVVKPAENKELAPLLSAAGEFIKGLGFKPALPEPAKVETKQIENKGKETAKKK